MADGNTIEPPQPKKRKSEQSERLLSSADWSLVMKIKFIAWKEEGKKHVEALKRQRWTIRQMARFQRKEQK